MFHFSQHSHDELKTLHPHLQGILTALLMTDDFRIDQGGRTPEEQQSLFDKGRSKLKPPKGKHLIQSDGYAYAVDLWPYFNGGRLNVPTMRELEKLEGPLHTRGVGSYAQFAWFICRAMQVGEKYLENVRKRTTVYRKQWWRSRGKRKIIKPGELWQLRCGIDWNRNGVILSDQEFNDYPHIELMRVKA